MLSGALPVADNLNKRGMRLDKTCQLCGIEGESINHVLFACFVARQVWELTGVPSPKLGFHNGSVFSNIQYLLLNKGNVLWPEELRKSFPWIVWRLWKNRNGVAFEGVSLSPLEVAQKCNEDWKEWTEAQMVVEEEVIVNCPEHRVNANYGLSAVKNWIPPDTGWLKCNLGMSWSKRNMCAGGAWVLRNQKGIVLLQDKTLGGLISRPNAWPSFRYQSGELRRALFLIKDWKFFGENSSSYRGANVIAQSVTKDLRHQSYVASGFPKWLKAVFDDQRVLTSVES